MKLTREQSIALAFDPSLLFEYTGLEPDPWQEDLLRSKEPRILLNCCRQAGKSTTVAALALHTALYKDGSLVLLLSRSLRQSSELFRKVLDFYNAVERPVSAEAESTSHLELSNGSRVLSLPGSEENIRSFSGVQLLVIDEAARVPDELYKSVRPMLAVSGGRLVCLSTPFGRRGFFFEAWHDLETAWQRFEIHADEVPRISSSHLAEEMRTLGPTWFDQEYDCSFEGVQGLVYPDLAACAIDESVLVQHEPLVGDHVGGIDFGFRDPFAAIWGVHERQTDILWIIGEHYERQQPLHHHAGKLPRGYLWHGDPSGALEIREMHCADIKIRKAMNDIKSGIAAVTARIQTGRLRIVRRACPHLLAESRLYRYRNDDDEPGDREKPIDADNHAMDAMRYLVCGLDRRFLARFRRRP